MEDVSFDSLVGTHILSGVDRDTKHIKNSWGDGFEHCQSITFVLDEQAYIAVEDPDDGYRSSMRFLRTTDAILSNMFRPHEVVGRKRGPSEYGEQNEVLEFTDAETGKIVLAVGTSNTEDYYPCFVAEWTPENLAANKANAEGKA